MTKKTDWVKRVSIVLAVLFFIMWMLNVFSNITEQSVLKECQDSRMQLHKDWQSAYNTLNNCFQNDLSSCNAMIPKGYN